MNLRNRSLLIIGLVFFAIFIILAAVSFTVMQSGLERIEYTDMSGAVGQVESSLNAESASLLSTTQDWGWWDETASFAAGNDSGYVGRNLDTQSLATIRVHLFIILDRDGNLVYGRVLSPDFQQAEPLEEDILLRVRNTPSLFHTAADDPGTSGVLLLPQGPMIVASTPILPSDREGPSRGTIIMGRDLNFGPLQRIDEMTGYTVQLLWQNGTGAGQERFIHMDRQLEGVPLIVVPDNGSVITGYRAGQDLAGVETILAVSEPRELYQVGLGNIDLLLLFLAGWGILTGIIVVIVMDRTVLRRLDLLATRVRTLPQDHESVPAPVLAGDDELAVLERDILASRASLVMSERQLRVFINALPDPAAMYSRDGTILLANTAFGAFLDKRPEVLAGTRIYDHLTHEEIGKYRHQAEEVILKRTMLQFEVESRGKTLLITHYPVLDSDGNVILVGMLTFDISERKRLENALRRVTRKISLLNTVIFNDIQNKVFVQRGYQELLRRMATDPRIKEYLGREETAVMEIQSSLEFARQYNDMGINPPRWQNAMKVMVFAISHLDLGSMKREFRLGGLEIYADALLERALFNLAENTVRHGRNATVIRAGYTLNPGGVVITIEDDGVGIPAEVKESIFEKGSGTGGAVGLFLVREILSITGLTIRETGEPGKGARFEITVPEGSYRLTEG